MHKSIQQTHIPLLNNLRAHNRSAFKGLLVIVKNQFPYGGNEWMNEE